MCPAREIELCVLEVRNKLKIGFITLAAVTSGMGSEGGAIVIGAILEWEDGSRGLGSRNNKTRPAIEVD